MRVTLGMVAMMFDMLFATIMSMRSDVDGGDDEEGDDESECRHM